VCDVLLLLQVFCSTAVEELLLSTLILFAGQQEEHPAFKKRCSCKPQIFSFGDWLNLKKFL